MSSDHYPIVIFVFIFILITVFHEFGIKTPFPKYLVNFFKKSKESDVIYTENNTSALKIFITQFTIILFIVCLPFYFRVIEIFRYGHLEYIYKIVGLIYTLSFFWFAATSMSLVVQLSKVSSRLSLKKKMALYVPLVIFFILLIIFILSLLPETKDLIPIWLSNYVTAP